MSLNNEKLVKQVNEMTIEDLRFILTVWQDRIVIWNPNTRSQHAIDEIWMNGTAVELGIAKQE